MKHPQTKGVEDYDFALLLMNKPVDFADPKYSHIRPICPPTQDPETHEEVINQSIN